MADVNVCSFIGRLGSDPEMRYLQNGTPLTKFNIAIKVGKDGTMWLPLTFWGKVAETANEYLTKGDRIFVSGELSMDEWTTDSGEKKSRPSLTVRQLNFVETKGKDGKAVAEKGKDTDNAAANVDDSDWELQ